MRLSHKSTRQEAVHPVNLHALPSLTQYASGSRVPQTGIYEMIHHGQAQAHEVVLIQGNLFPRCEGCRKDVRFRLLRRTPDIFDGGFRPDA